MSLAPVNRIGSGHSSAELAFANWWVRHRLSLRSLGYGLLVAWILASWLYGIWMLFDTFALSYPKEQRYAARIALIAPTIASSELSAPIPLDIGPSTMLAAGDRQHFLAPVGNANTRWWAEIRYRFRSGDTQTELQELTLLPNETRVAAEFNNKQGGLTNPSLSVESITWKRLDPAVIPGGDYAAHKAEIVHLVVEKPVYQSDIELEGKRLGQSAFTLRNPSGFRYRNVELLTLLYRDGSVVGANKLLIPYVEAGSTQEIRLGWPENPLGVSRVEVQSFLHVLDPESVVRPR